MEDLALEDMQSVEPGITSDVYNVLSVDKSVASRCSYGGTAPENVRRAAAKFRENLTGEDLK